MNRLRRRLPFHIAWVSSVLVLAPLLTLGQKNSKDRPAGYDHAARATVLHAANVYVTADADAQKISLVTPGHEVVVIERTGPWVRVFANTDAQDDINESDKPEFGDNENANPASGWIRDKGIVSPSTPSGAEILYGTAANLEDEASQPHAPKGAAESAHLLYRRVFEYFPDSPLAPAAAWRSADVRWQLDKADNSTLPSAKEQEAYLRPQLYEGDMKRVLKLFPGTKYAALAAYDLLDNKLCGDWQGLPRCPEMETNLYAKYAQQYPESPKAPEALYNAVYRQGVLVTMYTVQDESKRATAASQHAQELAKTLQDRYPQSDFTARAASIAYRVQQGIAIYGSDRD